ncbi:MAG TPA: sugar nucleotide-binding protein [Chloroflexia bacterium]|nr:sugar nucleotide-binding protein [Chloroflexia bacterium]
MTKPRLLVIGGSGFVGARVVAAATTAGYRVTYTYGRAPLALPLPAYPVALHEADGRLEACLAQVRPQIVLYCAAPLGSQDLPLQWHVNVGGVQRTLAVLRAQRPPPLFIYVSTNAVFGGGQGPYAESAVPDPTARQDRYRHYAVTKALGEQVTLGDWANSVVARTSFVDGYTLLGTLSARLAGLVEQLRAGQPVARFADRYLSPTLVDTLVSALLELMVPDFTYRGVLHLAGQDRVNDYQYGQTLARHLGIPAELIIPDNLAYHAELRGTPVDSSLATTFTQHLLRTPLLGIREQFRVLFPVELS